MNRVTKAWGCVRVLIVTWAFCAPLLAQQADDQVRIIKGPYLQNLRPDAVTIMWETNLAANSAASLAADAAFLQPGHAGNAQVKRARSDAAVTIHELEITGLKPDSPYFYRVRSNDAESEAFPVRTLFYGLETGKEFVFNVYGDSRGDGSQLARFFKHQHGAICDLMRSTSPDARFVIHTGDIVLRGAEYERWENEFFAPAKDLMHSTPIFPAIGNHEGDGENYVKFFSLPNPKNERWYAFRAANATYLMLDSQSDFGPESEQYRWLEKELERHDQTWLFVSFHKPALSSGGHGNHEPTLQQLVPLFEKHGVDAIFAGHDHNYEMSVKDEMVHLTAGGGGAAVAPVPLKPKVNPYSKKFHGAWHYCRVSLDREMVGGEIQERMRMWAVDLKGTVFHGFTITKKGGARIITEGAPRGWPTQAESAPAPASEAKDSEF